jgi:hypothetical protein
MKNRFLYGLFGVLFVAALLVYIGFVSPQNVLDGLFNKGYAYSESQQGIKFVSNEAVPSVILEQISGKPSFILSPYMFDSGELNTFMSQALVQQQIVFTGHQKLTTALIFVHNSSGDWVGCQTDFGTADQSTFITKEECREFLDSSSAVLIEILLPDETLSQPIVEISSKKITIAPKLASDVPGVNFLLMRSLYSDAEDLIGVANSLVDQNLGV